MPTAWLNLRYSTGERYAAFEAGLARLGFATRHGLCDRPRDDDLLVTWNRIGSADDIARRFRRVVVAENGSWGKDLAGHSWLTLARERHNTAGMFPVGGADRWDGLGVVLEPWRGDGETVILPQRGIGSRPTAMPHDWPENALRRFCGRIRLHPGRHRPARPLRDDLARCGHVVTWGSAAAVQALMMGVPVTSEMPGWIGEQDNTDAGRLEMFRRMAWAQWRLDEIAAGVPFERLL